MSNNDSTDIPTGPSNPVWLFTEGQMKVQPLIRTLYHYVELLDYVIHLFKLAPWSRGHAISSWSLQPRAFRDGETNHSERNRALRFIQGAQARHASCPQPNDLPGWLTLMQHYGLPTRLLDWTTNPFVALYFAVATNHDRDGAVVFMNPFGLNASQNVIGMMNLFSPPAIPIVTSVFGRQFSPTGNSYAVTCPTTDLRMLHQSAVFTLHDGRTPLEDLAASEHWMIRVKIPKRAKSALKQRLEMFGVSASTLFPDLEHLASDLAAANFPDLTDEERLRTGQILPDEEDLMRKKWMDFIQVQPESIEQSEQVDDEDKDPPDRLSPNPDF